MASLISDSERTAENTPLIKSSRRVAGIVLLLSLSVAVTGISTFLFPVGILGAVLAFSSAVVVLRNTSRWPNDGLDGCCDCGLPHAWTTQSRNLYISAIVFAVLGMFSGVGHGISWFMNGAELGSWGETLFNACQEHFDQGFNATVCDAFVMPSVLELLNHQDAEEAAYRVGGRLAVFDTAEKAHCARKFDVTGEHPGWIGLVEEANEEGSWHWNLYFPGDKHHNTTDAFYTNWIQWPGFPEPNQFRGRQEDCAVTVSHVEDYEGLWEDVGCNDEMQYIVELEPQYRGRTPVGYTQYHPCEDRDYTMGIGSHLVGIVALISAGLSAILAVFAKRGSNINYKLRVLLRIKAEGDAIRRAKDSRDIPSGGDIEFASISPAPAAVALDGADDASL